MSEEFGMAKETDMLDGKMQHLEGKLTPAERTLWAYIQANLETLAFENGASLASKSGVSPNTVSRFLRRLGVSAGASLFGGLAFGFGGHQVLWLQYALSHTLLALPFCFLAVERVEKETGAAREPRG